MKKLISLFLSIAMLLSLAACTADPAATTAKDDPGKALYTQALEKLTDVTLDIVTTTYTNIGEDEYSNQATQALTYKAMGTEDALIVLEDSVAFSIHSEDYGTEDDDSEPLQYRDIWHKGTLYTEMEGFRYRADMDVAEATERYTPVGLMDAGLYGSITSSASETGTLITFSQPTAGETWILPQDAKLLEASGTAFVDTNGVLTEMNYEISYTYGPTEVKKTVQSKPAATVKEVSAPTDPQAYTTISYIDAMYDSMFALATLFQADTMTVQYNESLTSEAAALTENQTVRLDLHGRKEDTKLKIDTSAYFMDYNTMESQEITQEETYIDGKLTSVVGDGLPTTNSAVTYEFIRTYAAQMILSNTTDMNSWTDATYTDLGSVILIEYTLNDNFGNTTQNSICSTLWNDPNFLLDLSSGYKNDNCTGYLSIDKYTGLPVASGYSYKGVHTIDGYNLALTMQVDQSIEAPAKGAYREITGEMPAEKEPETTPSPLFYKVTGTDGQQMWLLGTIHIGDERTAYLPEEIRKAFESSDALALECNSEAFDEQVKKDSKLAAQVSALYFSADGKELVKNGLEAEEYTRATQLLKATGNYSANMAYAKPYVWSNAIEMFYLRQAYQLHGDQGIEERLMDWAEELDTEVLEIESSLAQLQMLTGFSTELQLLMLEEMLNYDPAQYQAETLSLFELWCAGDEDALRAQIAIEWDEEGLTEEEKAAQKPLYEEYNKAMNVDRNKNMLDAAVKYLESGKVVFYAVGLAHLLDGTNGLVDTLQQAGYTVEQVTFAK